MPPVAGSSRFSRVREAILEQKYANVFRPGVWKRNGLKERCDRRLAVEQSQHERLEPVAHLARLNGSDCVKNVLEPERFEPHLPIEPRLMRGVEPRTASWVAGLPAK